MGRCVTASRVVIVLFNILFTIIGLIFVAGGLFLKFGSSVYKGALASVESSIKQSIYNTGGGNVDINLDLGSVTEPVAFAFIGLGLFILVICFLGCCGACYNFPVLIMLYIVPSIIILAAEIVVVILFLGVPSVIQTPLASSLKSGIQSDFQDISGTNLVSLAWNVAMQQFKCCGANDYSDFTGASKWNTAKYSGTCSCTLKTPLACCMTLPSGNTASDLTCATTPTTSNNYLYTGCVKKVWNDYILSNQAIIGGAFTGLAVFQTLLIILAFIIFCGTRKEVTFDDGPMKKNKVAPMKTVAKTKTNVRPAIGQRKNKVSPARY
ncbi:hypothetical protein CHS0354_015007 [Potamilus streckersoni]|uniref:Tetraspanin n=1 Tax=Potamilus streckersoni TaxID=2493646 RepID=A0AAE0VYB4_9BIVA|nr:hypothetical protein CHS0354_015007 [Potamilus streckersoni]